jgi:hypothetical protein
MKMRFWRLVEAGARAIGFAVLDVADWAEARKRRARRA